MTTTNTINSIKLSADTQKYLPENSSTGTGLFKDVMDTVGGAASVASDVFGGGAALGSFDDLLAAQMEVQLAMQTTSMQSNVEKSKHETKMAPIRNIRVS